MKRLALVVAILTALTGIATTAVTATSATASQYRPTLDIQFAYVGCHTWSLNGGPARVEQDVRLQVGESLRVVNHDFCTHTLVQTGGSTIAVSDTPAVGTLRHVQVPSVTEDPSPALTAGQPTVIGSMPTGAGVLATFSEPGHYEFTTHSDDSAFGGLPTVGLDNQLVLHVQVVGHHNDPIQ